jgi:hypothetical protein
LWPKRLGVIKQEVGIKSETNIIKTIRYCQ